MLTLNLELIKTPKECVEYVLVHELCHLLHHDHSPEFYKLLDRSLPDWMKRKHKLEMALA
jgi:predicted metal-dependent hydrolase